MLTLQLSLYALEIPNDPYPALSQNLIGCSTLSQEYWKLIGWSWETVRRQTYMHKHALFFPLSYGQ